MSHHKMVAAVVMLGGAYNLYYDFKSGAPGGVSWIDYAIDGAVFLGGASLFF